MDIYWGGRNFFPEIHMGLGFIPWKRVFFIMAPKFPCVNGGKDFFLEKFSFPTVKF